jgi:3-oxoadipate enol-lactonase
LSPPPTLIVVGDQDDPEIVERSRTMSAAMPNSQRTIIMGAGHIVNLEKPREFNQALAAFLRSLNLGE